MGGDPARSRVHPADVLGATGLHRRGLRGDPELDRGDARVAAGDHRLAPSWDSLYEIAANQQGCFTREQAREAGFSDQLLYKHVHAGNLERVQRGIYRVTRFPESGRAHEDLVILWLWSSSEGVFSHETALRLHGLSDTLPSKIHLTLPVAWRERQLTPPPGTRLSFAEEPEADRGFLGAIPVTRPARTINDVATASGDAIVVEASVRQAIRRGLAVPGELLPAVEYIAGLRQAEGRLRAPTAGSWLLEDVSGACARPPRADWRVDAEDGALTRAMSFSASASGVSHRGVTCTGWTDAVRRPQTSGRGGSAEAEAVAPVSEVAPTLSARSDASSSSIQHPRPS